MIEKPKTNEEKEQWYINMIGYCICILVFLLALNFVINWEPDLSPESSSETIHYDNDTETEPNTFMECEKWEGRFIDNIWQEKGQCLRWKEVEE